MAPEVSPTLQYASSLEIQAEQRTETVKHSNPFWPCQGILLSDFKWLGD
jgi:hypothetical protein